MKKTLLLLMVMMCVFSVAAEKNPQSENSGKELPMPPIGEKSSFLHKISLGGNIGGGFTNNYYYLSIAPRITYNLFPWLAPGISLIYQYSQEKSDGIKWISNAWGGGVFLDVYPIKWIYGHIEYQHIWWNQKEKPGYYTYKFDDDFLLLGGGVRIPIGNRAYMYASVLWDVLNNDDSFYENPIYNVGFGVDL